MAPNKGTFDLRKWRCGKIDKLSAPAKRFLTTVESIVITLALIASLGIASPLMASGVEPSPEAAVGVIGQDEATGIDNDECVESEDGGDLECETTTAPGSDGGNGAGSGSDSGDSANTGGAGTGGANGSAVDSAGTGDESDVDDDDADDADDAEAADTSDTAENDTDKESGKDGDEKSDDADVDKSDKDKEKASKAEATTDNTFEKDGGQLNLGYLFSHYNVISVGDAALGHTVGPVLIGGDLKSSIDIGGGVDTTYEEDGREKEGGYVHKGHTYIQGDGSSLTGLKPHNSAINLYLGTQNIGRVNVGQLFPDGDKNGSVLFTDDYLDFTNVQSKAIQKSADIANDAIDLGMTIRGESFDFAEGVEDVYAWQNGKKLILKAGRSYKITAAVMNSLGGSAFDEIIIDASGVVGVDGSIYQGGDASKLPETTITVTGEGSITLLQIKQVRYKDATGEPQVVELPNASGSGDKQAAKGLPLVFNAPDAGKATTQNSPFFGHVIAPKAQGNASGDYNGCWLVASMEASAQGHMWPYNGKTLYPTTTEFKAKKYLYDAEGKRLPSLEGYEFQFELWDLKNDRDGANATEPDPEKKHILLDTATAKKNGDIEFKTKPTYTKTDTYHYLIVERMPTQAETQKMRAKHPNVELVYDTHVEHITVEVTSEMINGEEHFNAGVTVRPLKKPIPKNQNGQRDTVQTDGTTMIIFENRMRERETPKAQLNLTKEMASGQDADANQEFDFDVTLYVPDGTGTSDHYAMQKNDATEVTRVDFASSDSGCPSDLNGCTVQTSTVSLKVGDTLKLIDLPDGARYEIREQETEGYEIDHFSGACDASGTADPCTGTLTADAENGVSVTATNRQSKVELLLPSAGGRANPLMTAMFGLGIVFAGLLIAVIYARRSGFTPLQ